MADMGKESSQYRDSDDENFSYLEEGDVYEEYLDPRAEIEVGEDEEIEIIEIVPPPPSPFGVPMPPFNLPPRFAQRAPFLRQEIELEDGEVYEYEPVVEPQKIERRNVARKADERRSAHSAAPQRKPYSAMPTSANRVSASNIDAREKEADAEDGFSKIKLIFKIFFGTVGVLAMIALCSIFIIWNYSKISRSKEYKNGGHDFSNPNWMLSASDENDTMRRFYEFIGDLSNVADYRDMLVKGTLQMNGNSQSFYCIRRSDGNCYVKIEDSEGARAYYVTIDSEDVYKLLEMRAEGRRELVPEKEALILRALANFDEHIFKVAFGHDVRVVLSSSESAFSSLGGFNFDGQFSNVLKARACGVDYKYYFSQKDGSLLGVLMDDSGTSLKVKYSDYQETDGNVKFPFKREIFVGDKPVASVSVKIAVRNKGFIIP